MASSSTCNKSDSVRYFEHFFKNLRPYGKASEAITDNDAKKANNFQTTQAMLSANLHRPDFAIFELSGNVVSNWEYVKKNLGSIGSPKI